MKQSMILLESHYLNINMTISLIFVRITYYKFIKGIYNPVQTKVILEKAYSILPNSFSIKDSFSYPLFKLCALIILLSKPSDFLSIPLSWFEQPVLYSVYQKWELAKLFHLISNEAI
jgi:hypothetical protein